MKKLIMALAFLLGVVVFTGCDGFGIMPPIAITFRESLLPGQTKVLQITNKSGTETLVLRVDVFNRVKNEHAYQIVSVSPGGLQELGCLEMNWVFEQGEKYKISADGYLFSVSGTVP